MKTLTAVCFLVSSSALSQVVGVDTSGRSESRMEEMLEEETLEEGQSQWADRLMHLREHGLDLNTASESDLEELPGLTPLMARSIVRARGKKLFHSANELISVEGMTPELLEVIRPLVYAGGQPLSSGISWPLVRMRSRVQSDLLTPEEQSRSLGSPLKFYERIIIDSRRDPEKSIHWEAGLLTEKDAGERFSETFGTGYVAVEQHDAGLKVLFGDFLVQAGRGLVFARSMATAKSADVAGPARSRTIQIEPYRSTDENNFFRGVAAETAFGFITLYGFVSRHGRNGSVDSLGFVRSFDEDGLFRTPSELKTRQVTKEALSGGGITLAAGDQLKISLTGYSSIFDRSVSLPKQGAPAWRKAGLWGAGIAWRSEAMSWSAEIARDSHGLLAFSAAGFMEPRPFMRFVGALRSYPPDFQSIHGFSLSEGGSLEGEEGMYAGVILRPSGWLRISSYYDVFNFTNRFSFPVQGNELLLNADVVIDRSWALSFLFRQEMKPAGSLQKVMDLDRMVVENISQRKYRMTLSYGSRDQVRWQARMEIARRGERGGAEYGFLVFQDLQIRSGLYFSGRVRVVLFSSKSFDSRIYTYEWDVPGSSMSAQLWGSGMRFAVSAEYLFSAAVRVSAKYAQSVAEPASPSAVRPVARRLTIQCDLAL